MPLYFFKEAFPRKGMDAQEVGTRLAMLREQNHGELTEAVVVKDAANKQCPFHKHFTWNDRDAVRKMHRLEAQSLIRAVQIRMKPAKDQTPVAVRAFHSVKPTGSTRHYTTLKAVYADNMLRKQVLQRALNDVLAVCRKYKGLKELEPIAKEAQKIFDALKAA